LFDSHTLTLIFSIFPNLFSYLSIWWNLNFFREVMIEKYTIQQRDEIKTYDSLQTLIADQPTLTTSVFIPFFKIQCWVSINLFCWLSLTHSLTHSLTPSLSFSLFSIIRPCPGSPYAPLYLNITLIKSNQELESDSELEKLDIKLKSSSFEENGETLYQHPDYGCQSLFADLNSPLPSPRFSTWVEFISFFIK
jgi:hypothetical protein